MTCAVNGVCLKETWGGGGEGIGKGKSRKAEFWAAKSLIYASTAYQHGEACIPIACKARTNFVDDKVRRANGRESTEVKDNDCWIQLAAKG